MEYVEILRARRILAWYTGLIIAGLVIEAISYYGGQHHNHQNGGTLPFSILAAGAGAAALIVATLVAPGLSAEAANTTALIWTRPAPRDAIAARFIGIDVAAILIGYVIMLAAMVVGFAIVGGLRILTFDPLEIVRASSLALCGAIMWYAVISVAASRLPGRGPLLAGLAWGVFPALAAFFHASFLPIWLHDVIYVLNIVNPVAWLGGTTPQGDSSIFPLSLWWRVFAESAIAIALAVASVRLWSTREA
ncbi:MAG: hypothetical protein M3169_05520 [Candidatus Eremiobacteraeota bacterium]|nr:hypothetical protein [Candidatus Eremiobacteraeota bacterium]